MDSKEKCMENIKYIQNGKYKSFNPALIGLEQIVKELPLKTNIPVLNTFNYMYYKFGSGIYVEIRGNKLVKYFPFINDNFINEFSQLISTNNITQYYRDKGIKSNFHLKRLLKDKRRWKANNCLIKVIYDPVIGESHTTEFKDMLEGTLKYHKIKDIQFFVNRKDFPILTKNGTEPYHHIYGENFPLISHKYDKYAPIVGFTNRLDLFRDIMLPTYDCWQAITKKFYPPECRNHYIFTNEEIPWKNKIETAVFRGKATGCHVDFKNPRLLITKINQEWNREGSKYKGWINAGISSSAAKDKKTADSEQLTYVDLKKLGIKPLERIDMDDQRKYKYIFDIQGNSSAFRLLSMLSFKSVLLKVESEYKMWIDEFLVPYEHYIPVKRDFSDLAQILDWCHSHDQACKRIAENSYKLYKKIGTEKFVYKFISEKLNEAE
jgi:hypothetical protein